jgi:hypothetical protein
MRMSRSQWEHKMILLPKIKRVAPKQERIAKPERRWIAAIDSATQKQYSVSVTAMTKSEARAKFKKLVGKLPVGFAVEEVLTK